MENGDHAQIALKLTTYNLTALICTTLGTFDNDVKACYDRIVPSLPNLIGRKLGLPLSFTRFYSQVLSKFTYRPKTTLGLSDASYGNLSGNTPQAKDPRPPRPSGPLLGHIS